MHFIQHLARALNIVSYAHGPTVMINLHSIETSSSALYTVTCYSAPDSKFAYRDVHEICGLKLLVFFCFDLGKYDVMFQFPKAQAILHYNPLPSCL